jgi:hypothetical protein
VEKARKTEDHRVSENGKMSKIFSKIRFSLLK